MSNSSFFSHISAPSLTSSDNSDTDYTLGICFAATTDGQITSVWYYMGNTNSGGITGTALIYPGLAVGNNSNPSPLGSQDFTFQATVGWQEIVFDTPVSLQAGGLAGGQTFYVAAIFLNNAHYSTTANYFTTEKIAGDLIAGTTVAGDGIGNGRYIASSTPRFPNVDGNNGVNYWIDVTFVPSAGSGNVASSFDVTLAASDTTPTTGDSVNMSLTADETPDTYEWSVTQGTGTFTSSTSATPTYTPTAPGKQYLRCVVTSDDDTGVGYIQLDVSDPIVSTSGSFNATVTDTLSASAAKTTGLSVQRGGKPTVQTRSFYGHRLSFGDPIVNPTPFYDQFVDLPATYCLTVTMERDCRLTKIRFLKAPDGTGTFTVAAWQQGNHTPLVTKDIDLIADLGGWIEIDLDTPVALSNGQTYFIGYFAPNGTVMRGQYVLGAQQVCEYPFLVSLASGLNTQVASGYAYANELTYPAHWITDGYYIDPVVEWDSTDTVYTGGTEYFKRWSTYASSTDAFPIGFWRPLVETIPHLSDYGVNTIMSLGDSYEDSKAAVVASGLDIFVDASDGVSTINVYRENPAFYDQIKGYFIRDEPDLVAPWTPPATLQALYNAIRQRDSSKLVILNLSYPPVLNSGWAYLPAGATIDSANATWRQFAQMTDITSCDFYMENPGNHSANLGLWCNPRIVQRMQDLSDKKHPIWSYVQPSAYGTDQPTPQLVHNSIWGYLIGGARGIMFFDYIFNGDTLVTDNGMASNSAMAAMVTALTSRIQSLKDALLGPADVFPVAVTSSNKSVNGVAGIVGGEFGVPIHYTARQDSNFHYVFAQSIRPGTTTGTFTAPSAANKTITVIDESRTISANSGGIFTDTFTSDYQVHLYRWS